MGPICFSEEGTAECFKGAWVQLGNAPCFIHGEAVGISQAPWHPEGGNPEVNSSRRDVRKELTVRASRGRQVAQQGQVPATPCLAGSQGLSGGTHASHAWRADTRLDPLRLCSTADNKWFPLLSLPLSYVFVWKHGGGWCPGCYVASPGWAMQALRTPEDAVKLAMTLCDADAAWRTFCLSSAGEGGGGRQEEGENGSPKSELISGLCAAICMYKLVFAYASLQLCSHSLCRRKGRRVHV